MMRPSYTVVDHQAHWYPAAHLDALLEQERFPRTTRAGDGAYSFDDGVADITMCPPSFHDLDAQIADMDAHGIDVAVVSTNLTGEVSRLPVEDAVSTLELLNAELARAQSRHPSRIVGLAMLPMQDRDAALQVLDRAVGEHGLAGVCVLSNVAGRPIVGEGLLDVYRRIEELDVPLYLHPSHLSVVHGAGYHVPIDIGLGWMFETGAAALSLVYGGVLDACPDLVVVHPHLGGALPALVDRVVECEQVVDVRHDLRTYLRRNFFVDSVQKTPGALTLAIETYGLERIVYGTDYPWIDRSSSHDSIASQLGPERFERILGNIVPNLALPGAGAS